MWVQGRNRHRALGRLRWHGCLRAQGWEAVSSDAARGRFETQAPCSRAWFRSFCFPGTSPGLCPSGELCVGLLGEEGRSASLCSVESACVSGWARAAVVMQAGSRSPPAPPAFPERPTLPSSAHLSLDLSAACSHSGVGCRDPRAGRSGREAGRACPHAGPLIAVLVPTSLRLLVRRGTSRRLIALFKL